MTEENRDAGEEMIINAMYFLVGGSLFGTLPSALMLVQGVVSIWALIIIYKQSKNRRNND